MTPEQRATPLSSMGSVLATQPQAGLMGSRRLHVSPALMGSPYLVWNIPRLIGLDKGNSTA